MKPPQGGFVVAGPAHIRTVLLLDSIATIGPDGAGRVVVSGSHGGGSAARFAIAVRPRLAVFNDAGVGKDGAGICGLALMQAEGLAALTVAHSSARIGEAASTLRDGVISHVNAAADALGARPGMRLHEWLAADQDSASGTLTPRAP